MSRRLVLDDGRSQRELVLREKMTVGRDPACDISDSDPRLSRKHAEFLATANGLTVRGATTGRSYRFAATGSQVRVDRRDAASLRAVPHLRMRR